MRLDRDLPFPFPPGFERELSGLPLPRLRDVQTILDAVVNRAALPFLFAAEQPDPAIGLEEAIHAFSPLREQLLDVLEASVAPSGRPGVRRRAVSFANRRLDACGWRGSAAETLARAIAHTELLTELSIAYAPRLDQVLAVDARRHAVRLEFGLFAGLAVADGVIATGRIDRVEAVATDALLAVRRVHALVLGAPQPAPGSSRLAAGAV